MSRHLNTREEIEAQMAGNLENLVEALRLPADYPARAEYLSMVFAKADVLIAPITAAATAPWHETPAVAAYIADIDISELSLRRPMVVMGSDTLQFTGDPVEQLQDMRRDALNEAFGCTFSEANAAGRAHEYCDFDAEQLTADDVLAKLFGNPSRFGNEHPDKATLMMRAEVRIKAAQKRHGIGMWAGSKAA